MIQIKKGDIVLLGIAFILMILSFFIIESFILPLAFTVVLVYILNPLYVRWKKVLRFHFLTSVTLVLFAILIFLIPISYSVVGLANELNSINETQVYEKLASVSDSIEQGLGVDINLISTYNRFISGLRDILSIIFAQLPELAFELFLIVFFYYYFSKRRISEYYIFKELSSNKKFKDLHEKFKKLIYGVVYGQIFVRFIQALVGTLFLLVIGVPGAISFGILLFFTGFVPVVGTGLVWLPLIGRYLLLDQPGFALLIAAVGLVVSVVDNLLLPYVISERTNIGPVLTLLSILGGLKLFGIYGMILGPVIVGLFFIIVNEIFVDLSKQVPRIRKYIWTEEERQAFRKLKTDEARDEFRRITNEKYARFEKNNGRKEKIVYY
ncbi:MAG: AI-2E family transporter [Nanoarchaeota archaeon]